MGFKKGEFDKVFDDLKSQTKKTLQTINYTQEVKKDIQALNVYDSGQTNDKSFGLVKENRGGFTILLETPPTVTNQGFFYPIMPFFGLGTSQSYGPRKWFDYTVRTIEGHFNIKFNLDKVEIVKRTAGSFMGNHVDKGDSLSFILYLNNNYIGGETVLENEVVITPKTGRLLVFTNGVIPHRVNEIKEGIRYVIAGWFV